MYKCIIYLRPDRYSNSPQTAVRVRSNRPEEQHNITEGALDELKLGEGASSDESWPSQGGGVGACSSGVV